MAEKLNNLIPAMKDEALHESADVNADETWCSYQSRFSHKKHYMDTFGEQLFRYRNDGNYT